jgi:hypothetical protein
MIAGTPHHGGATWAVLQYLLGLRRLGFDPYFVEPVDHVADDAVRYADHVMSSVGLDDRWALLGPDGSTAGMDRGRLTAAVHRADLLLNVSGLLADEEILAGVPVRVYLDLDPGFVQLWHASGIDMRFDGHTHFVTLADTIGEPSCPIPSCDRTWLATLPPVVLDEWPMAGPVVHRAFTTVGHWRGYGSIDYGGIRYGQKAHSLRPMIDVPDRSAARFVLALGIHPDEEPDLAALAAHGWTLLDPFEVAATPADYRSFVQGSLAEFGLTKHGYVISGAGWFSDRSACYLASGRPVVAQHTGFDRRLPTGEGMFACRSGDEVVSAVEDVLADYERHRTCARAIAEEHLDSDRVLGALLSRVGF